VRASGQSSGRGVLGNPDHQRGAGPGGAFTLGLGIALFAVLTSAVGAAAGWIAGRIGMSGDGWIVILEGFAVSVLADTGLMVVLLRVVSGVPVPWRDLFQGALAESGSVC